MNTSTTAFDIKRLVISMYYTERLKWIRDCRNITQKEIADFLGVKQQQYARYEKGINIMPITYLPKLCEFFDLSADYILGLTDEMVSFKNRTSV